MDAADEGHDDLARVQPQRRAGGIAIARSVAGEIGARSHDVDTRGICAVQLVQRFGFVGGVGDQAIGLGDYLLLTDLTRCRARGCPPRLKRQILHRREGVGSMYEEELPQRSQASQPTLPGQPVVRMNQAVVPGLVTRFLPQNSRDEGTQLSRQICLVPVLRGPAAVLSRAPGAASTTGASAEDVAR